MIPARRWPRLQLPALARTNPVVVTAAILGLMLVALALLAPVLSPFAPDQQRLLVRLKPPIGFAARTRCIGSAPTNSDATCSRAASTGCGSLWRSHCSAHCSGWLWASRSDWPQG